MGQSRGIEPPRPGLYRYSKGQEEALSAPPPLPRDPGVWDEPTRASQVVTSLAEIEAELWRERQSKSPPPPPVAPGMTPAMDAVPVAVHDAVTAPTPTVAAAPEPGPEASLTDAEQAALRPAWRWGWLVAAAVALLVAAAAGLAHDGVVALGRRAPAAQRAR